MNSLLFIKENKSIRQYALFSFVVRGKDVYENHGN